MASNLELKIGIRQVSNDRNMFEFTVATPLLRSQFRIPRSLVNQLRVELEKAIIKK